MEKYFILDNKINEVEAKKFTDTLFICKINNNYFIVDNETMRHIACDKIRKKAIEKYEKVKTRYEELLKSNSYKNICKESKEMLKQHLKFKKVWGVNYAF